MQTPHFADAYAAAYEISPPQNNEIKGGSDYPEESKNSGKGSNSEMSLKDFKIIENIGSGSFGIVYVVEKDGKQYAMKELMKEQILRVGKTEAVLREQEYLKKFNNPAIPKLYYTFQDANSLYFVMEHIPNGSLHQLMEQVQTNGQKGLPSQLAKFYAAQLVLTLEYIHSFQIAHRDLKPPNILIDEQFYLKIIDFGDAKEITEQDLIEMQRFSYSKVSSGSSFSNILLNKSERDNNKSHNPREGTFVGTPLYVAPEMLEYNHSGHFSDLWSLGCIIYQLLTGVTPFHGKNHDEVFHNILERKIKFPLSMERDAVDLIDKLLAFNPENRLGYKNLIQLKQHPYFHEVDLKRLAKRELPVPNLEIFGIMSQQSLITDDSQDSALRKFGKSTLFSKIEMDQTPDCCTRLDYNKKIFEGHVKVKRRLFFYKKRFMILQDDGLVVFARQNGRVRCDLLIDETSEIIQLKQNRFQIKTKKVSEVIETPDTELWLNMLYSTQQQMSQQNSGRLNTSGNTSGRVTPSGRISPRKTSKL
eukprot:403349719